jgi:hypothetical protein
VTGDDAAPRPLLRVVRGDPTEEELAALVAVLAARAAAAPPPPADPPRTWAAYWRTVRAPLRPGPGSWRASGLPR